MAVGRNRNRIYTLAVAKLSGSPLWATVFTFSICHTIQLPCGPPETGVVYMGPLLCFSVVRLLLRFGEVHGTQCMEEIEGFFANVSLCSLLFFF